jgi:membrane protein
MLNWRHLAKRIRRTVWAVDLKELPPYQARVVRLVRVALTVGADVAEGTMTLHATSLVYTTLLAMVPLLAVSFSVLKGLGVHNQIEPLLLHLLAPLGEKGVELTQRIVSFVNNIKVGVLGAVGLAFLLYTAVSLVQKVEVAFNYIWHVRRMREVRERFTHYFSVIFIGPVLVFAALGVTASALGSETVRQLTQVEPLGTLVGFLTRLLPYLLVIAAFTFIYVFIPNTRVRLRSAFVGGVVAALLWQSAGWAFASFVATSSTRYAIYSSFAILLLFMIWLYLGWLILLVGASVAFYDQHPEFLGPRRRGFVLTPFASERVALLMAYLIGLNHVRGEQPWSAVGLARRLGLPFQPLTPILDALCKHGVLVRTDSSPPGYVPARDIDRVSIKEVLDGVRTRGDGSRRFGAEALPGEPPVEHVLAEVDAAVSSTLAGRTLGDLVAQGLPAGLSEPEPRARQTDAERSRVG